MKIRHSDTSKDLYGEKRGNGANTNETKRKSRASALIVETRDTDRI